MGVIGGRRHKEGVSSWQAGTIFREPGIFPMYCVTSIIRRFIPVNLRHEPGKISIYRGVHLKHFVRFRQVSSHSFITGEITRTTPL